MLLRRLVLRSIAPVAVGFCLTLPAGATADAGGTTLPGGALPSAQAPPEVVEPAAASGPSTEPASQVTLTPPTPALPVLATPSRRSSDPVTHDLAALIEPSPVAAIDGHVVYVRQHMGHSELVDVADPANPRILLLGTREFGDPVAGRDVRGHPVIVISPCAATEEVLMQGQAPRCPLRAVDLTDGSSRALPATTGALLGDLAGNRLVFARRSGPEGERLYTSTGESATALPLPKLGEHGDGWLPAHGKPAPGSVHVSALDVDAAGRLAVVLEYRSKLPAYSSSLWVRGTAAGSWKRLTTLGTRFTGQGTRQVLAPQLVSGGVQAYVEGVVESPSYAGRWTDAGALTTQLSLRRSIGRATILHGAAYDGNRLVFVDWLPGVPCGSEGALACGLRAAGPISIR